MRTLAFLMASLCAHAANYWVSTTGSGGNAGNAAAPWSRASVLPSSLTTNPKNLQPGDVVCFMSGTYNGPVILQGFVGTAANRIVFQPCDGATVIFDQSAHTILSAPAVAANIQIQPDSNYITFRANNGRFIILDSNTSRVFTSAQASPPTGCFPACRPTGLDDLGNFTQVFGLEFRDNGIGIGSQANACGSEYRFNKFYYGGWEAPDYIADTAFGFPMYLQNEDPNTCSAPKIVDSNVMWTGVSQGIQIYGTSGTFERNMQITNNVFFNNGILAGNNDSGCMVIGGSGTAVVELLTITGNVCFQTVYPASIPTSRYAQLWKEGSNPCVSCTISNNYWFSSAGDVLEASTGTFTSLTETGNTFIGTPSAGSAANFPNSTFAGTETVDRTFYRVSPFSPFRGTLVVVDGDNSGAVSVTVPCVSGGSVQLREMMNYTVASPDATLTCNSSGNVTATYSGSILAMVGATQNPVVHTGNRFRVFDVTVIAAAQNFQNTVTTTEYAPGAALGGTVPVIAGHLFKAGDFPAGSFPKVNVTGSGVIPTQVKVLQRHGDGSIKHAMLAFIQPSPNVNYTFSSQVTCNCSESGNGGISKFSILAGDFEFKATITPPTNTTGLANQTVSARAMLTAATANIDTEASRRVDWQESFIWMDGPIVTTWILQDFSATEAYNFGYKMPSDFAASTAGDCTGQTTVGTSQTVFCATGLTTELKAGDYAATMYNSAEIMRVFSVTGETIRVGVVSESTAGRRLLNTSNDGAALGLTRIMGWNWTDPSGAADKRAYPQIRCEFWKDLPANGEYRYRCGFGASNHSTTKAMGPVVYGLSLTVGNSSPSTVYTYDASSTSVSRYNMWLSPGKQFFVDTADITPAQGIATIPAEFWGHSASAGTYQRARVNTAYPWRYWVVAKLIPPYDTSFDVLLADNTAKLGSGGTANYPKTENNLPERSLPLGQGAFAAGWGNTGGRPELGLFTSWNADTMTTSGGDWRMQHMTMRHAYAHWGFAPIFYSETDTNRTFNRGVTPVAGRPWSTRSRAQIYGVVTWPSSADRPPVAITQQSIGYNFGWRIGASVDYPHQHDPLTVAWILSGDFPVLWRMWTAAGYMTFTGSTAAQHRVDGATGKVSIPYYDQTRAHGRTLQTMTNFATFSPDNFHETTWLRDVKDEWTASECGWHQVTTCSSYNSTTQSNGGSGPTFGTIWTFGDTHRKATTIGAQHRRPFGTNPLALEGVNARSNGASVVAQTAGILPVKTSFYVGQTWMENINRIAACMGGYWGNADAAKVCAIQEGWCGALPQILPDGQLCSIYWMPSVKMAAVTGTAATNRINYASHTLTNGQYIGFSTDDNAGAVRPTGLAAAESTTTQYRVCNASANDFQVCQVNGVSIVPLNTDGTGTWYVLWEARSTAEIKTMYESTYLAGQDYSGAGLGSRTSWNDGYGNRAMGAYAIACSLTPGSAPCLQYQRSQQAFQCYQAGQTTIVPGTALPSSGYNARGAWSSGTAYVAYDSVTNGGVNYVAISSSTGVTPGSDSTKWQRSCYNKVTEATANLFFAPAPGTPSLSPASLSWNCTGTNSNNFTISSTGGNFAWTASESLSWLTLGATSGTTPSLVSATINCAGLSDGVYSGVVSVTGNSATSDLNVSLNVSTSVEATPLSLSLINTGGGGNIGQIQVARWPTTMTVTSSDDSAWLSTSVSGGTVTVTAADAGLSPGTYNGNVIVSGTAPTSTNSVTVPVAFQVLPGSRVKPGITTISLGYKSPIRGQTCAVVTSPGTSQNHSTLDDWRFFEVSGLTANTLYMVAVTCGATSVINTNVTTLTSISGTREVHFRADPPMGDTFVVDWGSTTALGSTITVNCPAGPCSIFAPVPAVGPVWYRFRYQTGGVDQMQPEPMRLLQ